MERDDLTGFEELVSWSRRGALLTMVLGLGLFGCSDTDAPMQQQAPGFGPQTGTQPSTPGTGTTAGTIGSDPTSTGDTGTAGGTDVAPGTGAAGAMAPASPGDMDPGAMDPGEMDPGAMDPGEMDPVNMGPDPAVAGDPSGWNDPGPGPFEEVPEDQVADVCKLDVDILRSNFWNNGAVFRYGKLCYSEGSISGPYGVFSVTKTVAGTVMAAAYWETRDNAERILPSDPISEWGGIGSTRISEYAGMVTSGSFSYDTLGTNLARTGPPMEYSLGQGSVSGATRLTEVRDNLFEKLGVGGSWPTGTWGTGANISLEDMGRIGIALGHNGWWNGEQVLDPDWVYWMTHPHWENLSTSYGMYTWLNHRGNAAGIGGTLSTSGAGPAGGDPCAPAAVWQRYPHPPSEATDCNPIDGNTCEQTYDTGVFSAQGLGGQFIVVHRGLDLVMVARSYSGQGGPVGLWEAVRPAVVALDPMFMGDEAAFCEAYGNGDYAPDLVVEPVQPDSQ
jgi:hypothetical protein